MIQLNVLSYNGDPITLSSVVLNELGGSIGRAETNALVLPDPERSISRVHAHVVFRANGYHIVDNGSNPISLNGRPLGSGREHRLAEGDQVQIGGYLIQATLRGIPPMNGGASNAATDLFGDIGGGLAAPQSAPPPTRSVMHNWTPAPQPLPASPAAPLVAGHIPEDWDPFADLASATASFNPHAMAASSGSVGSVGSVGTVGLAELAPSGSASIDDLFGLSSLPPNADPLGGGLPPALRAGPNTAGHADPLRALAGAGAPDVDPFADLGSDLNTPMPLSKPVAAPVVAPVLASVTSRPPFAPVPAGAVFSWDDRGIGAKAAAPSPALRPVAPQASSPLTPPRHRAAAAAAPAPAAAEGANEAALLAALLQGLATPGLQIERLTPAMMTLIGQSLREATRGAVELLKARSALKSELRAEMTHIVARENNPLKFSPSVEVALQHLLGPPAQGFMASAPAVRDAFDDLRAHQLGVMAGMRAALDGVVDRFDPAVLEGKLARRSAIDSLLPGGRKARLWELYQEMYGQISREMQDDVDELFGRAFLRAYEAQLDSLAPPRPRSETP